MKQELLYKEAVDTFGIQNQTLQLAEECAELIQAANKMIRYKDSEKISALRQNLIEEMIDTEIMIGQLKAHYGINLQEYSTCKTYKLAHLEAIVSEAEICSLNG